MTSMTRAYDVDYVEPAGNRVDVSLLVGDGVDLDTMSDAWRAWFVREARAVGQVEHDLHPDVDQPVPGRLRFVFERYA